MKYLKIADIKIKTEYINNKFFDKRYKEYEHEPFDQYDLFLKTQIVQNLEMPKGKVITVLKTNYVVEDELYRYICSKINDENFAFIMKMKKDYSDISIMFNEKVSHKQLTFTEQEYLFTGSAFNDRLMTMGGIVLHGSSISYNDEGIIFSANSGVGKSTHVSLWKECFGNDVTIINDDKPAIRFTDNSAYIYGTPWSGKTDLNTNKKVKLKAIVFVERGKENSIKRINTKESLFRITEQTIRPFYDTQLAIKSLDMLGNILERVPVYVMNCNISYDAVYMVKNKLFN